MAVLNIKRKADSFCVSNDFVDKFMCDANGSFVKVYLYCLRYAQSGQPLSISKIAGILNMISSDVISALKYWDNMGVLNLEKSDKNEYTIELYDTFQTDRSDRYQVVSAKCESNDGEKKPAQINYTAYSRSDLLTAMQGNEKIKQLFTYSGQLLNKTLNTNDMNLIYMFYDYLKLPAEVIFLLIEYCVSNDKSNMRYIEKVAMAWADNGINTVARASAYIRKRSEESAFENKYKAMFKISGRDFTESELKFLKTWTNELKVSDDAIKKAYETTVMNTGKVVFKYMDSVIKNSLNPSEKSNYNRDYRKKNAFQDYGGDGYNAELEIMNRQMAQEE